VRVLAGVAGALLVALMLSEFFVTFMLPRRVRRDPRIARGLNRLLWIPWRASARQLAPSSADTLLGLFGPLALILQLVVWALGLLVGYGLIEWAVAGGSFWTRLLNSSGLFLSAGGLSGSNALRVVALLEAATGVGVLFIVIGYMPSVYSAFSRRETAVSQLATRAGSPPAAATLLHRAAGREHWKELERDLQAWEEWAAELMETHLTYPLLAFYRSQHVNQNWLAALTAMVDVAAFVKATLHESVEAADITFRIGRHALADLALQFRLEPASVDRLSEADFAELFAIVDRSTAENVDSQTAQRRLARLREEYEPNAQALAEYLALELPPWFHREQTRSGAQTRPTTHGAGRDLVGSRPSSPQAGHENDVRVR
jgi:hypothetical protein